MTFELHALSYLTNRKVAASAQLSIKRNARAGAAAFLLLIFLPLQNVLSKFQIA
jgi:hypothetical protein